MDMIKAVTSESHLGADLRKLGLDSEVVDRSTINDTFLLAWLGFSCDGSKIECFITSLFHFHCMYMNRLRIQ